MFDENLQVVFCNEQYRRMYRLTADRLRVNLTKAAGCSSPPLPMARSDLGTVSGSLRDAGMIDLLARHIRHDFQRPPRDST